VYHFYSLFLSENHCSSSLMMNIFEIYFEHILLIYVTDFLVFLAKINLDIVIWNQGCPEVRKIGGVNDFFKKIHTFS
jgi:hypothetical protein